MMFAVPSLIAVTVAVLPLPLTVATAVSLLRHATPSVASSGVSVAVSVPPLGSVA